MSNQSAEIISNENDPPTNIINKQNDSNTQRKEKNISLDINAPSFESKIFQLKSSAKPFYPKNDSHNQHNVIPDTSNNNNVIYNQRPVVMSGYRAIERLPYTNTFMNGNLMHNHHQQQQQQQLHQQHQQLQVQNLNLYQIQNRLQANANQAYAYQQYGMHLQGQHMMIPQSNVNTIHRNVMMLQNMRDKIHNGNMNVGVNMNMNMNVNVNMNGNNNSHSELNLNAAEFTPKSQRMSNVVVDNSSNDKHNKSNLILNPNAAPYQYKGNKSNIKVDNKTNQHKVTSAIQEEPKDNNINNNNNNVCDDNKIVNEVTQVKDEVIIKDNEVHDDTNEIKEHEDDKDIQQDEQKQNVDNQVINDNVIISKEDMNGIESEESSSSQVDNNKKRQSKLQMLFDSKTEIKVETTVSGITQKTKVKQKESEVFQQKYNKLKQQEVEFKKKEEKNRQEEERKKKEQEKKRQEEERKKKEQEKKRQEEEKLQKAQQLKEQEQQLKEQEQQEPITIPTTISRNYFITPTPPHPIQPLTQPQPPDYIYSYRLWQICLNTDLLPPSLLCRFTQMKTYDEVKTKASLLLSSKQQQQPQPDQSTPLITSSSSLSSSSFTRGKNLPPTLSSSSISMQPWGRKELTNEIKQAEEFKKKLEETRQRDPIKYELTEYLNILTVDNYNETKDKILTTIQSNIEYQNKFIEVLFQKAIHEKSFVFLYANLCKELNQSLQQVSDKNNKTMRSKLIEKCRDIFKIENNVQLEEYVNVKDPTERESKIKKFVLGNVNFIGELINIQVMKKEIVFQCTKDLFKRYERENTDEILRLVNLEAIVIFLDKFGMLLQKQKIKMKNNEYEEFTLKLNTLLDKLDTIQQHDDMPGYIKYKIINLIEKKKNNWEESEYEKNIKAKGKDDVRKAYEQSLRNDNNNNNNNNNNTSALSKLEQDSVNDKIRNDLIEWKDFIENGGDVRNYQWEIITELYQYHHNTLGEILIGFFENCFDFVDNKTSIQYANSYWSELIQYYAKYLKSNEINELVNTAFDLFRNITTLSLDNIYLYNIMANIILCMTKHKVCRYCEIERFKDINEDDLKGIFKVICIIGQSDEKVFAFVEKTNVVKCNRELYDEVIQG